MNKKDEFAINWMNNPEKDVVKEPEVDEKKVSEKIKEKLKETEEQKKRDAEIKAKEKERLAKNTPVSGLSFANVKSIGQERVDEKIVDKSHLSRERDGGKRRLVEKSEHKCIGRRNKRRHKVLEYDRSNKDQ